MARKCRSSSSFGHKEFIRGDETERRLREFTQIGSYWHGENERANELLLGLLRATGRAEEADRFERWGLEPGGRTASAE